ncbi:MAG TPA: M55 family metallopeptidase, partial [Actinomycetota bacterium]|nr:M55 family metallopeptidase [Actinomycetota bacterium]
MSLHVFISVDMEGIAGITTLRQTVRGTDDYAWGREIMTDEANA